MDNRFILTNPENAFQEMKCGIDDRGNTLTFNEVVDLLNDFNEVNEQLKQIILFANELIQTQNITQHDYWKFRTLCKEKGVDLE